MTDTPVNRDAERVVALAKFGLERLEEAETILKAAKIAGHEARLSGGMNNVQKAATLALDPYPEMITSYMQSVNSILNVIQTGKYEEKSGDND